MKRTGLLAAGMAVLVAACGPRTAAVSIDDVDPPVTTVTVAANADPATASLPAAADRTAPEPDDGAAGADHESSASTTTTSTVVPVQSPAPVTTTTTTIAQAEISLPDLSELDHLLADVEALVDDIDLSQTEGDLP